VLTVAVIDEALTLAESEAVVPATSVLNCHDFAVVVPLGEDILASTELAGALVKITAGLIFTVAVVEVLKNTLCTVSAAFAPATGALSVVVEIDVTYPVTAVTADAGATELRTPRPKAATATSATRLKVVFVDICFLSISRTREFPSFGLNQISLIRFDESHVLIHQIPHRVSGRGRETYF
jgi:hypothetical protein